MCHTAFRQECLLEHLPQKAQFKRQCFAIGRHRNNTKNAHSPQIHG